MFLCVQECNLIFISCRDVFEFAALISPSAILDFHSQHSVHSAAVGRMDGMAFCSFRNRNAEKRNARISHSDNFHSRIVNKNALLINNNNMFGVRLLFKQNDPES